jgi:hypothetical protein
LSLGRGLHDFRKLSQYRRIDLIRFGFSKSFSKVADLMRISDRDGNPSGMTSRNQGAFQSVVR